MYVCPGLSVVWFQVQLRVRSSIDVDEESGPRKRSGRVSRTTAREVPKDLAAEEYGRQLGPRAQ